MDRVFSLLGEKDISLPVYVTGVGFEEYQDHIIRKNGFPYFQLAFCENGIGTFIIADKEFRIDKGMAFFFHPNIPHEYYPVTQPWSIRWITFSGSGVNAILSAVNFEQYRVCKLNRTEEVSYCYNKLYKTLSSKKSAHMLEASGIFYSFLVNLTNIIENENSESKSQITEKLGIITEYIKSRYQKDLSLEELAELAGISPSYLCRIFNQKYDMSPFEYILLYRINAAKELLINYPEKSIKSIALETGFNNCSYFGSVFKKFESCSPKQFRNLYSKI